MSRDIWCFEYGGVVYKASAEGLKGIVHEVLNQEFYFGHDFFCEGILIDQIGNSFRIAFTEEHDNAFSCTVEANPQAVFAFLKEMVELSKKLKKHYRDIEEELYEKERTAHERY